MDLARYQKEIEERVETLQTLLEKECDEHTKDNNKYKKVFHQLLKDLHVVVHVVSKLEREIHINEDSVTSITIDRQVAEDIVREFNKFHDKYSDKAYAFLKEIIRDE